MKMLSTNWFGRSRRKLRRSRGENCADQEAFERKLLTIRKQTQNPLAQMAEKHGLIGFPMVYTRAKFIIPSAYGDDIIIESRVTEFRNSSFDVTHHILKDGKLAVEGFETRVLVAPDPSRPGGMKSHKIPAEILAAFGS